MRFFVFIITIIIIIFVYQETGNNLVHIKREERWKKDESALTWKKD